MAQLESLEMVAAALETMDQKSRCRDMRGRWQAAVSEKLFYQKLMRVFAVAALAFLMATLVLFFVDGASFADAAVTFISGVVSGGMSVFFRAERGRAETREGDRFKEYNDNCPEEVRNSI